MRENCEIDKLNLKAMNALCDVINEIQEAERKRAENGVQKYISDAVHEKLYELWDAVNYYMADIPLIEEKACFGTERWESIYDAMSPEEFIEKINNYISKKNEKHEDIYEEMITGDEIEVYFYGEYEHLNEFVTEDDKHLYYLSTMSNGYAMAISKKGFSTTVRADCVKKTGKHYNSLKEFVEDASHGGNK